MYSIIALSLPLLQLVAAGPIEVAKRDLPAYTSPEGFTITGSISKRDLPEYTSPDGFTIDGDISKRSEENPFEKRKGCDSDCISSCGSGPWVPISFPHGYSNAVNDFCNWAGNIPNQGPAVISPGQKLSATITTVDVTNGQVPDGATDPIVNPGSLESKY